MTKSIILRVAGGPEQLSFESVTLPAPGPGQVLLRHTAIGVNFLDIYHRTGLYPLALPSSIGSEAAALVDAVGPGVTEVKIGQRVAYAGGAPGSYAEARLYPADRLVPLPDHISDAQAASLMLQGMTVYYLLRQLYRLQPGETILLHAAAGGVGLIACQWAKGLGATVIGTVGSAAKAALAREHGADQVIDYSKEDFVAAVRDFTGGAGVPVVYDSVGKDTFLKSLDCLRTRGMLVSFGQSSGAVEPLDLRLLAMKGSLFVTRPTLASYIATRAELLTAAQELFQQVERGVVKSTIGQTYKLSEAAQAHRDLEARKTTGSTILLP